MHPLDKEALLRAHTSILDGRVITFRGCDWYMVPSTLNFTTVCLWVRISGLPFGYLDPQWAQNILSYVGFVEIVQGLPHALPLNPKFRALIWIDSSLPLIPSCYLPLFDYRIVWVYFRYEGVFRFCKSCGKIGHATASCRTPSASAIRLINKRINSLQQEGFQVLRGPNDLPLYTNAIRGLTYRFHNRNFPLNLLSP
ncbi:putative protein MSS51-like protein mitochondrial [Bienertia sinuspersici]